MTDQPSRGWRRARRIFGPRADEAVGDELRFHLEMRRAELVARGLPPEEADHQVRARFGDVDAVAAECRTITRRRERRRLRIEWLDALAQDLRFAARTLHRDRLPAAVAVLCLALGIGATTTVFGVASALLLEPLPFPNGNRLLEVVSVRLADEGDRAAPSSMPDLVDLAARQRTLAAVGAYSGDNFVLGDGSPERVRGARATAGLFRALGTSAEHGRLLVEADNAPGAAPVVVVSRSLADARLGGAAGAVGKTLRVNGRPHTVVGVLPERWRYPERATLWLPLALDLERNGRDSRFLDVVATLRPGASIEAARADLATISAALARAHVEENAGVELRARPLRERYVGEARPAVVALGAAAALLLLIACANVASLQLARATAREREMAVRTALGAGRGRVARQLLTENVLLAVCGGLLGVGLAYAGGDLVGAAVAGDVPSWMTFEVDPRVLAFTLFVAVGSGVLFGLAPVARLAVTEAGDTLRSGRGSVGPRRGRLHRSLVAAELALSLVLLVGAGLALQSFGRLRQVDPGFQPAGLLTFRVPLTAERYAEPAERARAVAALVERVGAVPGARSAGAVSLLPIGMCCSRYGYAVPGQERPDGQDPMAPGNQVTPGWFRAMGIPLLAGRDFAATDAAGPRVVVVNREFVERHWPGEDAIGKEINVDGPRTVVGVVGDVKQSTLLDAPEPQLYFPHAQDPWDDVTIVVRGGGGDPASLAPAVRAVVRAFDPDLPMFAVQTMDDVMRDAVATSRVYGMVLAIFAAVAVLLAASGVYGVMAYLVAQRSGELGIRLALGARPGAVRALVLRQGAAVAVAGLLVGGAGAAAAARWLAHELYGVRAGDPWPYLAAAALLGCTALAATWLPARRASRVDPAVVLRGDG